MVLLYGIRWQFKFDLRLIQRFQLRRQALPLGQLRGYLSNNLRAHAGNHLKFILFSLITCTKTDSFLAALSISFELRHFKIRSQGTFLASADSFLSFSFASRNSFCSLVSSGFSFLFFLDRFPFAGFLPVNVYTCGSTIISPPVSKSWRFSSELCPRWDDKLWSSSQMARHSKVIIHRGCISKHFCHALWWLPSFFLSFLLLFLLSLPLPFFFFLACIFVQSILHILYHVWTDPVNAKFHSFLAFLSDDELLVLLLDELSLSTASKRNFISDSSLSISLSSSSHLYCFISWTSDTD